MNKGKRLKKNLKKKIWLDRESKPDLCDDRTQRAIHWGNILFIRRSNKKKTKQNKKWFIRILHHLYQIALSPVNAKVRVRFPVTPEFFQFLFQLRLGCSFPCKKHVHLDHVHYHEFRYVLFSLSFPLKVSK